MAFIRKYHGLGLLVVMLSVVAAALAVAVTGVDLGKLPQLNYGQEPTEELKEEARQAILKAEQSKSLEEAAACYEAFIQICLLCLKQA